MTKTITILLLSNALWCNAQVQNIIFGPPFTSKPIQARNIATNGNYSAFIIQVSNDASPGVTNMALFCYDRFGNTSQVPLSGTNTITPLSAALGEITFTTNGNLCFLATGNGTKKAWLWEYSLDSITTLPHVATLVTTFELGCTNANDPFLVTMKNGVVGGGMIQYGQVNLCAMIYRFPGTGVWTNYGLVNLNTLFQSGLPSSFIKACEQPQDNTLFTFETLDGGDYINVAQFAMTNGMQLLTNGVCSMNRTTNSVPVEPKNGPYAEICTVIPISDWNSNRIIITYNNNQPTSRTGYNFDWGTFVNVVGIYTNPIFLDPLFVNLAYNYQSLWFTTNATNEVVRLSSSIMPSLYGVNGATGTNCVTLKWLSYNTNSQTGSSIPNTLVKQSIINGVEQTPVNVDTSFGLFNFLQNFPYNGDFTYIDANRAWHLVIDPAITNYFVDWVNGNDTNNGTSWATAFKTQQRAANVVAPGNTVTITNNHWFTERVTLKTSSVTWIGLNVTNWGFSGNQFVDKQYITGFYVHNTNGYNSPDVAGDIQDFSGIYCAGSSWIITNCFLWENGSYAIAFDGRVADLSNTNGPWPSVTNYLVINSVLLTNGLSSMLMSGSSGVLFSNVLGNNTQLTAYCTNRVYKGGIDADGMYVFGFNHIICSNLIKEVNYLDPNNTNDSIGNAGPHCDGIQSYGIAAGSKMGMTSNILVIDNVIDGCDSGGIMRANGNGAFWEGSSNIWMFNNIIRWHRGGSFGSSSGASFNCKLIGNTIIGQTNENLGFLSQNWAFSLGKCTNAVWQNNICMNFSNANLVPGGSYSGLVSDHNLQYRDDGVNVLQESSYAPFTANDIQNKNPGLFNVYANPPNPKLTGITVITDAGADETGVNTNDWAGVFRPQNGRSLIGTPAKWDIGAFEFVPSALINTLQIGRGNTLYNSINPTQW